MAHAGKTASRSGAAGASSTAGGREREHWIAAMMPSGAPLAVTVSMLWGASSTGAPAVPVAATASLETAAAAAGLPFFSRLSAPCCFFCDAPCSLLALLGADAADEDDGAAAGAATAAATAVCAGAAS